MSTAFCCCDVIITLIVDDHFESTNSKIKKKTFSKLIVLSISFHLRYYLSVYVQYKWSYQLLKLGEWRVNHSGASTHKQHDRHRRREQVDRSSKIWIYAFKRIAVSRDNRFGGKFVSCKIISNLMIDRVQNLKTPFMTFRHIVKVEPCTSVVWLPLYHFVNCLCLRVDNLSWLSNFKRIICN